MRANPVHKNTMAKVTALKTQKRAQAPTKAPGHLRTAGKNLWNSVNETFDLEPHDLALLTALAETLDRKNQAEKDLREYGSITFTNRHGELKPHPAIAVVRDCNVLLARLRRELCLSEEEPPGSRPPPMGYGGPK